MHARADGTDDQGATLPCRTSPPQENLTEKGLQRARHPLTEKGGGAHISGQRMADGVDTEKRKSAYSSRLSRARAANSQRLSLRSGDGAASNSMANMAFAMPMQQVQASSSAPTRPKPTESAAAPSKPAPKVQGEASVFVPPPDSPENAIAFWEWNSEQKLMATTDSQQLLRVLDDSGATVYRVQLPREGRVIFLGWEPSGAALAAVQDHGGAFLWFPSKPDCVQQWEGMQFANQFMRSSALKRNAHFDTSFASWSEARKLVLGLADGNFACWDLMSNETFISRKHFAGKHKGAITCGGWGMGGQILALGSTNQLKVSRPLLNASWESTAAKIHLPDNELSFQELAFSPSGQTLSAIAGTSIFRHLCLYSVVVDDAALSSSRLSKKESEEKQVLAPVGEMRPDATIGGIQAVTWLDNEILAVSTSNGYIRLVQYSTQEGMLLEDQHKVADGGVTSMARLQSTGHLVIVCPGQVLFFNPLYLVVDAIMTIPDCPEGVRNGKLQACATGKFLMLGRTDGMVAKIPVPESLKKVDLELLTVRRSGESAPDAPSGSPSSGSMYASCGTPQRIMGISSAEGATAGYGSGILHAWSQMRGLLALVNSRNEVIVVQLLDDDSTQVLLRERLPEAQVVSVSWDPSTQSVLAIAIRHHGVALWDTKSDAGLQMWSGMSYKSYFATSSKAFDPRFTIWNLAGQLAVGMSDGSFATWDSMTMEISNSHRSGKHSNPIAAGDWFSSLFSPALAFASKNTIKISQGFEGGEWAGTALKLKLGKQSSSGAPKSMKEVRKSLTSPTKLVRLASASAMAVAGSVADKMPDKIASKMPSARRNSMNASSESVEMGDEGKELEFTVLKFSPSGRHIATLAHPPGDAGSKELIIYELQDTRQSICVSREVTVAPGDVPLHISWLIDHTLCCITRTSYGAPMILTIPPAATGAVRQWPDDGQQLGNVGTLVDASATPNGVIALALATEDGKGLLLVVTCPQMNVVQRLALGGKPQSIALYQPRGQESSSFLSIAFEGGGVEAWELPQAEQGAESATTASPAAPPAPVATAPEEPAVSLI